MAINFPQNPNINDKITLAGTKYSWNGFAWDIEQNLLEDDLNPKLSGDLDLNGSDIIGTGNVNINGSITIDGTISGSLNGDVSGDVTSDGVSSFSGVVDFSGATINNFPISLIEDMVSSFSLDVLNNVDLVNNAPTNGQVLSWNEANNYWEPSNVETQSNNYGDSNVASYLGNFDFHVIPELNATYDIGSAERKIRHLYLSDNSLKFVSSSNEIMSFGRDDVSGALTFNGNAIQDYSNLINKPDLDAYSTKTELNELGNYVNEINSSLGNNKIFSTITGAAGVVSHDCNSGRIFRHISPTEDFTANLINLGLNNNYATIITILIEQETTAHIASAVQIEGITQKINWQGGIVPFGTDSGVDLIRFNILNIGSSYLVLGQLFDFA